MEYIKIVEKDGEEKEITKVNLCKDGEEEEIAELNLCKDGDKLYLLDAQSVCQSQQILPKDCSPIVENYILSTPLREMIVKIEHCQMLGICRSKSFLTDKRAVTVKKRPTIVPADCDDVVYSLSFQNTWGSGRKFTSGCSFITGIKQDIIERKADRFCQKLSNLLSDEIESSTMFDHLNERQGYVDQHIAEIDGTNEVFAFENNYECNICSCKFTEKSALQRHLVVHTGLKIYECEQCGKRFAQSRYLKQHMVLHSSGKNYACDQCGKRFTRSSGLKQHIILDTGAKDYECKQCGKCFTQNSSLKQHMTLHTGVKDYECDQCGKCFTQNSSLKQHMILHTGAKDYECEQCGKRFARSSDLKKHMVLHTGVKDYECEQCGKRFTQSSDLKKHGITHWCQGL